MIVPRAEIARERRRQMQVRQAFDAGLALTPRPDHNLADFYLACADYIGWSMDRLHAQDQIIHDLLKARIPAPDRDAHERLDALNERQNKSRVLVETFRKGAAALRKAGSAGLAAFERAGREFSETFKGLLAPRKNPFFRYTDELFTDADWVRIAGVTEASLAGEERLFQAVQQTAPPGIDPAQYKAEHLPSG